MPKKVNKVIIDTNLWISFLITKDYIKLDELIISKKLILLFSQELLEEFVEVANRPKFKRYFSNSEIDELLEIIQEYAQFVNVKSNINLCRDLKDNFLLSLAADSNADFILTGDKDLLALKKFEKTIIITITDFLKQF
jgi:uncharacterized protein